LGFVLSIKSHLSCKPRFLVSGHGVLPVLQEYIMFKCSGVITATPHVLRHGHLTRAYKIIALIGSGGMGEVYRARHSPAARCGAEGPAGFVSLMRPDSLLTN